MKTEKQHGILRKYEQRLALEGKLKALLLALTIGFGGALILGAVSWYTGTNSLLLCLLIVAAAALIGTPLFYALIFRSSVEAKARRIDRIGLDERAVTMVELEGDEGVFARLQREDTRVHLEQMDVKQLRYKIPRSLIGWTGCVTVLGIAATVMCTMAAMGVVKTGAELVDPFLPKPPVQYVYIEYMAEEGGSIEGEEFQQIIMGEGGTEVMAVADEGWIFVGWDDGYVRPNRIDEGIMTSEIRIAIFEPSGEDSEGEDTEEGFEDPDGRPAKGENETQEGDGDDPTSQPQAGGKYQMANQVIDGETYYREVIDLYSDMINEYLTSGEEIPDEVRKIIETYLEIIG